MHVRLNWLFKVCKTSHYTGGYLNFSLSSRVVCMNLCVRFSVHPVPGAAERGRGPGGL